MVKKLKLIFHFSQQLQDSDSLWLSFSPTTNENFSTEVEVAFEGSLGYKLHLKKNEINLESYSDYSVVHIF